MIIDNTNWCNKKGSSKDKVPSGYKCWLDFYEKKSKTSNNECSVLGCSEKAEVGAHVYREGNSQDVYIVPMCYGHNNSDNKSDNKSDKFDLKGNITLIKRN